MKPEVKINLLGGYLLAILVFLITVGIITYFFYPTDQLTRALIFVGCSGGIGRTIYSIRGFYQNLGEGKEGAIFRQMILLNKVIRRKASPLPPFRINYLFYLS